jgi:hypothetical protein
VRTNAFAPTPVVVTSQLAVTVAPLVTSVANTQGLAKLLPLTVSLDPVLYRVEGCTDEREGG